MLFWYLLSCCCCSVCWSTYIHDDQSFVIVEDYEKYAAQHLDKKARHYYNGGAMLEQTLRDNRDAFFRLRLRPRFMRNVAHRDLSTTLLGNYVSFPVAISPTAMHRYAHPDGEIGTAKAAAKAKTIMTLSIYSSTPLEEVAQQAPGSVIWLQMHLFKDRNYTWWFVKRAERARFAAIVLTIDFPILGKRVNAERDKFEFPSSLGFANFGNYTMNESQSPMQYFTSIIDPGVTWTDVHWLTTITHLPVVVKGVLTAEDAEMAVQYGAAAILVSNHGGRQFDGVPATIDALPEVVKAVKGAVEVYMDGGIRTGADVFKALALGARAVFIGRPVIWGLVARGSDGVSHVLDILKNETDMSMTFEGCTTWKEINSKMVVREEYYRRNL